MNERAGTSIISPSPTLRTKTWYAPPRGVPDSAKGHHYVIRYYRQRGAPQTYGMVVTLLDGTVVFYATFCQTQI